MYPFFDIFGVRVYSFGLLVGLGTIGAMIAAHLDFKRRSLRVSVLTAGAVLLGSGVIGSKLDSVLISSLLAHGTSQADLLSKSGFTWFGGVVTAMVAGVGLARYYDVGLLEGFDSIAFLSLGLAIGRIGCFLAGDGDYGPVTRVPWGVDFSHGLVPAAGLRHPTMLYISMFELAIFAWLWPQGRPDVYARKPSGSIFAQWLMLTGLARFVTEHWSLNPIVAFGYTEAELVGLAFAVCGLLLLIFCHLRTTQSVPEKAIG
ncbi:MAG TPA: prolipoprotein diacylglyceryl transferase family protein [Acidobacteriaceae bacterium]|nr:prolipoprotein diacylglyceryl transferase family protein [Acidobacteriaceae bacterium]